VGRRKAGCEEERENDLKPTLSCTLVQLSVEHRGNGAEDGWWRKSVAVVEEECGS